MLKSLSQSIKTKWKRALSGLLAVVRGPHQLTDLTAQRRANVHLKPPIPQMNSPGREAGGQKPKGCTIMCSPSFMLTN